MNEYNFTDHTTTRYSQASGLSDFQAMSPRKSLKIALATTSAPHLAFVADRTRFSAALCSFDWPDIFLARDPAESCLGLGLGHGLAG